MDTACSTALDLELISVTKVASMLERATEATVPLLPATSCGTTTLTLDLRRAARRVLRRRRA